MAAVRRMQGEKRALIERHAQPRDLPGLAQVLTTLLPMALLWIIVAHHADVSYALIAASILLLGLLQLRAFVLMHECGHGSLFRSPSLNRGFGFLFGVITGMPQYVWSQHHHFHHTTNGNWAQYSGPLAVISVKEFAALDARQQRRYQQARSIWLAPVAGFLYLIFNPRLNWLLGSLRLLRHLVRAKLAAPGVPLRTHAASFKTNIWDSPQQYWHMCANNLVLLCIWAAMAWALGPALFFAVYCTSGALAGGAGIVLFTVQHNFEHSYASSEEGWCYDSAALHGTSYLVLPPLLRWFTANIGYHHVHHLSARIPNYHLAACHAEGAHLFGDVIRVELGGIARALTFILWDTAARRLVSVAEYRRAVAVPAG